MEFNQSNYSLQSSTKKQPQMMETQQSDSPNEQIAQHLAYNHSGIDV